MQTSWALPLILRKEKLTLQYITKLKSTSDNVPYTFVFELSCALFFEAKNSLSFQLWESEWKICCWIPEFNSNALINPISHHHLFLLGSSNLPNSSSDIGTKWDVPPDVFKSKLIEITSGLWWFPRNLYRWVESWRCNSTAAAVPNVYQSSNLSSQRKFVAFYFRWSSWSSLLVMNSSY